MPRKTYKNLHFHTAEQVKLNTKRLKCKVCGKKVRGKSTLSRHISHAHSNIDPVKREKMVIDEYFGQAKVDDAIKKYKARIYNLSTIPIDISRYIRLAEIEPDDYVDSKKKEPEKIEKKEKEKIEIPEEYDVISVKDSNGNKDDPIEFVENVEFDFEEEKLKFTLTQSLEEALPYDTFKAFIKKLNLEDSIIYISKNDENYPANKVDLKTDEEVAGDRVRCTVTYSGNSKKEKE